MVGSDCAPFHWEGLSQEWWIPQSNILIYFNEKMMEYYGVSLSTQVSDKPKKRPPECFEEIPQTVAVEADLVDEPGGLPNSHGDPQVTIG